MTYAFFEGVILGVTLAFLIGPAFIALLQTSIHRGFISGVQFAMGIAVSDATLIGLSYLGVLQILSRDQNKLTVGIVGGSVLILFGIITFVRKYRTPSPAKIEIKIRADKFIKYFLKGFLINILNPFLLIFWLGVMSFIGSKYGVYSRETFLFFSGILIALFTTDTIKCFIAHKIKKYLNFKFFVIINRAVGLLLIMFGVFMFIRLIFIL